MSEIKGKSGQKVVRGQQIGNIGFYFTPSFYFLSFTGLELNFSIHNFLNNVLFGSVLIKKTPCFFE